MALRCGSIHSIKDAAFGDSVKSQAVKKGRNTYEKANQFRVAEGVDYRDLLAVDYPGGPATGRDPSDRSLGSAYRRCLEHRAAVVDVRLGQC